jgi:hypothetical protein
MSDQQIQRAAKTEIGETGLGTEVKDKDITRPLNSTVRVIIVILSKRMEGIKEEGKV